MGQIPLFDELGHLIWTDREEFRTHVIPGNIQADWDHPQNLYTFVVQLYKDGFLKEAERGADRLLDLTNRAEEALLLKALILLKNGENGEAEKHLRECMEQYPERGVAHTYLARIHAARSESENVVSELKEGLLKEPNQETALRMLSEWVRNENEWISLLRLFSEREDAWLPFLEFGRLLLRQGKPEEALDQFSTAMERTRSFRPEENGYPEWEEEVAAMTVSALLRNEGLLEELVRFCQSYWNPAFLTPFHGMDYAHALDEIGDTPGAMEVLTRMLDYIDPHYQNVVRLRIDQFKGKSLSKT
ncbi:outer membrane protein assembly factor BamD (BamD/ComL family) [Melghirimyces profundicolus]|uniref:Outer membrane protein assembly factor BamD (BamD/ComL family) n=1 Tax=Melghirimyces profundicolus TaxID=1242148 RepID=A0A2T6BCE7_9BACL|nr:hypothetical protein [Melghirimyces profundicolus]PTX53712.1 outer membrane protein assembly factor BamD (BamD/ComL family) [Melghirimyces profundicolus]